ncbi:MAG: NAD(P)-dependent dehydrogenase (short-subunit alcohol dehydrogenase family) [Planctomycetota bacterium]|jgi:NAD(P)-dependent dehydrogenase (short-subunit alcohol dehydrogenase family)
MNNPNGQSWDVRGKTVLLTGGNSGIGKATVLELVRRGAHVQFTSRNVAKGEAALAEIQASAKGAGAGTVQVRQLDLASFQSIDSFAKNFLDQVPALHVLVHNAGLIEGERRETVDGFESTFGTNHLGTFRLNQILLPRLLESAPARVVVVASNAHGRIKAGLEFDNLQSKRRYEAVEAYSASKLANILFTRQLAKRLEGSGVTANCLHPGVVASNFNADGGTGGIWGFTFKWMRRLLLTPKKGARTSVHLCCEPSIDEVNGAYFDNCREAKPSHAARDDAAALKLWEISETLCAAVKRTMT